MVRKRYTVCRDSMICGLPALFPYIEWDEVGVASLYEAADSLSCGCYGKIIPNLRINGSVWSYRDLINGYYNKTIVSELMTLVETAIGKELVVWDGFDRNKLDLLPQYIYLATARESLQDMRNMKYMVEFYEARMDCMKQGQPQCDNESDLELCCLKDKFTRMGGDNYISFLEKCVEKANKISATMKEYAEFTGNEALMINLNIPLMLSVKDMGVVKPLIKTWNVGEQYYPGQFVLKDGVLYHVNDNSDGRPVNGTKFNPKTEQHEFNLSAFSTIEDYDENDRRNLVTDWWNLYCTNRISYGNKIGNRIECQGESQLPSLRMYGTYINVIGNEERPDKGKDWLYYYREGVALNIQCEMDDLGNILTVDGEIAKSGDDRNLYAFGDIIKSITLNKEESTITFNYSIGVHLVNKIELWKIDDDGNELYRPSDVWKIDDKGEFAKYGIDYSETFRFSEDSELSEISISDFDNYIKGDIADDYTKYEFFTSDSIISTDKNIDGVKINLDSQIARIGFNIQSTTYAIVPFVRDEYCLGVEYAPTEETDVYIQRGSASAFERHIKLSEIRTMDDMLKCATLPIVSTNVVEK